MKKQDVEQLIKSHERIKKEIWNEAVKATIREAKKYDGLIPSKNDRDYMGDMIAEKLLYITPSK